MWWTSAYCRLRSVGEFEAPLQISMGFASWQRYCTALYYSVSQTLRRWTEGATYIRQGGHHVGHWPTFLVLSCFFFFFSSPNLSGRRLDVYNVVWPSANLECRSEMCCTRLAGNAGPKKSPKIRHLGTIAQLCRATSSQLRHVSTIGKKLVKQQYVLPPHVFTIWWTSAH